MRPARAAATPAGASSTTRHLCGFNVQRRRREEENLRVRLAMTQIAPADVDVEDVEQSFAGVEADRPHHSVGVLRGGCHRHAPAHRADGPKEAERVGEGGDCPGGNQLLQPRLLAFGVAGGLPGGVLNSQCIQSRPGPSKARLAGDLRLVHLGRKAAWLDETDQRFAPRLLMRRSEQDAINVEDAGGQCPGLVGPGFSRFGQGICRHLGCFH